MIGQQPISNGTRSPFMGWAFLFRLSPP